jgi:hypothetical protein
MGYTRVFDDAQKRMDGTNQLKRRRKMTDRIGKEFNS